MKAIQYFSQSSTFSCSLAKVWQQKKNVGRGAPKRSTVLIEDRTQDLARSVDFAIGSFQSLRSSLYDDSYPRSILRYITSLLFPPTFALGDFRGSRRAVASSFT